MPHLSCGIVGLPNVGKSTLFNALTNAGAAVAPYPFCTIDPNVGVVPIRDGRVDRIAEMVGAPQKIYRTVEYVDVAGLVKDASKGAGRGNQFLEHVRACDALVQVVRCFRDQNVAHVHGGIDPIEDIKVVNLELILADLQTVTNALDRVQKKARHEVEARAEAAALDKVRQHLDHAQPVRTLTLSEEERHLLLPLRFLSSKSILYAVNIDEADLPGAEHPLVRAVEAFAGAEGNAVIPICAKLEEELAKLDPADAQPFLDDLGLKEPGLQRLVRATNDLLHLVGFFTFNEKECRAWTVVQGTHARDAAGVIHSDFREHFIRAEVTAFDDFVRVGGAKAAHEKGLLRIEGRDYVVRDGDIIYFRIGA
jgi:ribosome-binding ATPase